MSAASSHLSERPTCSVPTKIAIGPVRSASDTLFSRRRRGHKRNPFFPQPGQDLLSPASMTGIIPHGGTYDIRVVNIRAAVGNDHPVDPHRIRRAKDTCRDCRVSQSLRRQLENGGLGYRRAILFLGGNSKKAIRAVAVREFFKNRVAAT